VILLADPDPKTRGALRSVLEEAGHSVTAVATGLEAAQVLMQTVPRLIVLDLDVKWLSGRQLIEVLRRNPRTSFIPIVAVAGAVEDLRGIPLLLRPVDAEQLRALVDRFLPQPGHHDGPY
jgi:two-component system cell cycle response regulator DivK